MILDRFTKLNDSNKQPMTRLLKHTINKIAMYSHTAIVLINEHIQFVTFKLTTSCDKNKVIVIAYAGTYK